MPHEKLRIGIPGAGWWTAAGEALSHEVVSLPLADHTDGNAYTADLPARVENGEAVAKIIAEHPVDLIVDNGATGLSFVRGGGPDSSLTPIHEAFGVAMCSHLVDPIAAIFQGMKWTPLWRCLHSNSWVKAIWDCAQAEELGRFGIPNVIHLPMAAPDRAYNTEPLDPQHVKTVISFVGGQNTSFFWKDIATRTETLMPGALAHAVRADVPDMTYYKIYHDLYELAEPLDPNDDVDTQNKKTTDYFNSKVFYNAIMCLRNRDRFIIFLKRKMGETFHLVGKDWDTAYGLSTNPPLPSADDYFNHFRETAINLNLVNGNAETGLNMRHFEITAAGGFMLCYDQPELSTHFEVGKECAAFASEDELLDKIEYYLSHPQERVEIALAGQRRTLSQHLYSHRLTALIGLLREANALPSTAPSVSNIPITVAGD